MTGQTLRTVLYVDDDPDICAVVQTTLCVLAKLDVYLAHSGDQAIDRAYECRPDLILMDVMMPGLDGPSTLERMREHALLAPIPIVFLTAKVLPSEIARFLSMGAIGVLQKPFDPGRLCTELTALWNGVHRPLDSAPNCAKAMPAPLANQSIQTSFLERADDDVMHLQHMIREAHDRGGPALKDIERIAHSLHGTAAMLGFPTVSALSGDIERLVEADATAFADGNADGFPAFLGQLASQTELLACAVEAAKAHQPSATRRLPGASNPCR